jgi:lysophospholipase L1-like esterase
MIESVILAVSNGKVIQSNVSPDYFDHRATIQKAISPDAKRKPRMTCPLPNEVLNRGMKHLRCALIDLMLIAGSVAPASAAETTRIAFLGDSITYDGRWPARVESALRNTPRFSDAEIVNFGLGSETVSGLSEPGHAGGKFPRPCLQERLGRVLEAYKPTLVLACYGMNDGIYLPPDKERMKAYQDGIIRLKTDIEQQGGSIIFITPPLHNADKPSDDPQRYDAVLDAYGAWLVSQRAAGWNVIDIRADLKKAVQEAKSADPAFVYAQDGIHPGDNGHDLIAASVITQLWPILKLDAAPHVAEGECLAILLKRGHLLKDAWLTRTRHTRPGVTKGLPLEQANTQAAELLKSYRDAIQLKAPD